MDVIMAIKKQFELDSRFRNTLYVILSSGRAEPQGQIIKDFLYEIHLKYTGLHTYALYLRAMQNLDVNCDQLGKAMHVPMFEPQLSIVSKLLELEHSKESEYSRHMDASQGDKGDARPLAASALRNSLTETSSVEQCWSC
ncbi:coat protein [Tanacetum coccineum]|uniref:Coat protein n=1 Tax=Tanacetum coccineum TaxID=301880 RepID=A0ABQ4ZBT0_9ASTR